MKTWSQKYQGMTEKRVEIDTMFYNTNPLPNNSLSKRIKEVQTKILSAALQEGSEPRNSIHEAPDHTDTTMTKKVKTDQKEIKPTKDDLKIKISDLNTQLRVMLLQLGEEREKNMCLKQELSKSKESAQKLVENQQILANSLLDILRKLSPSKQEICKQELAHLQISELQDELQKVNACDNVEDYMSNNEAVEIEFGTEKASQLSETERLRLTDELLQTFPLDVDSGEDEGDRLGQELEDQESSFIASDDFEPKEKTEPILTQKLLSEEEIAKMMRDLNVTNDVQRLVPGIRDYMIGNKINPLKMAQPKNGLVVGPNWISIVKENPTLFHDLDFL